MGCDLSLVAGFLEVLPVRPVCDVRVTRIWTGGHLASRKRFCSAIGEAWADRACRFARAFFFFAIAGPSALCVCVGRLPRTVIFWLTFLRVRAIALLYFCLLPTLGMPDGCQARISWATTSLTTGCW